MKAKWMALLLAAAMLVLAAAPAALAENDAAYPLKSYTEKKGYPLTEEQAKAVTAACTPVTKETAAFILRSGLVVYDAGQVISLANLVPANPSKYMLLPLNYSPEDPLDEDQGGKTFKEAAEKAGKELLLVNACATVMDELGTYGMEYVVNEDGSLTIACFGSLSETVDSLTTKWELWARSLEGEQLVKEVTEEQTVKPAASVEEIEYNITTADAPAKVIRLAKALFGCVTGVLNDDEGEPMGEVTPLDHNEEELTSYLLGDQVYYLIKDPQATLKFNVIMEKTGEELTLEGQLAK